MVGMCVCGRVSRKEVYIGRNMINTVMAAISEMF